MEIGVIVKLLKFRPYDLKNKQILFTTSQVPLHRHLLPVLTTFSSLVVHSSQLSRNLRDSPGFLTCVPEGSQKSALAQIVPE